MVITALSFTKKQTAHLNKVCEENETSRAEFCRQAVSFCLEQMGEPLPRG
jgi:3-methyladenine DNA glycosylase AlkD